METINIVFAASITVFSLGLLIISILSYRNSKNLKLIFISLVFLTLLIKGILLSLSVFNSNIEPLTIMPFSGIFDLTILVLIFIATLKR